MTVKEYHKIVEELELAVIKLEKQLQIVKAKMLYFELRMAEKLMKDR